MRLLYTLNTQPRDHWYSSVSRAIINRIIPKKTVWKKMLTFSPPKYTLQSHFHPYLPKMLTSSLQGGDPRKYLPASDIIADDQLPSKWTHCVAIHACHGHQLIIMWPASPSKTTDHLADLVRGRAVNLVARPQQMIDSLHNHDHWWYYDCGDIMMLVNISLTARKVTLVADLSTW